jgi:DNA (cytosine-5)-methyltransferase 1
MHKENLNELALFAGAGGGILGGKLLGWTTICAVEWERYPASVLCARQNDGFFPPFPIWDDVQTFDGKPWRGIIDVVSGGFPCQDISSAGRGAGIDGERSGMWKHMARIIGEVRPQYVFVENSPMLTTRGLGVVLADLSSMGFDAKWGVVSAADVGANHQRERIWIRAEQQDFLSHSEHNGNGWRKQQSSERQKGWVWKSDNAGKGNAQLANSTSIGQSRQRKSKQPISSKAGSDWQANIIKPIGSSDFWEIEPNVGRVADGVAARVDRLKAIGNGQVPLCAATAWRLLNA